MKSCIALRLGAEVEVLDRATRTLTLANGERFPDRLVLATGSVPFVPHPRSSAGGLLRLPHPGRSRRHPAMPAPRPAAAWSSVAACWGWRRQRPAPARPQDPGGGVRPRLMPVQLDERRRRAAGQDQALGVEVLVEKAAGVHRAGSRPVIACVSGTAPHWTDVLLFSVGIRPADTLARQSGLVVGERGGICIDDGCHSSDPPSSPSASARSGRGASSAWWPPAARWPGPPWPPCAAASRFIGADMSTKLKLMGWTWAPSATPTPPPPAPGLLLLDRVNGIYRSW